MSTAWTSSSWTRWFKEHLKLFAGAQGARPETSGGSLQPPLLLRYFLLKAGLVPWPRWQQAGWSWRGCEEGRSKWGQKAPTRSNILGAQANGQSPQPTAARNLHAEVRFQLPPSLTRTRNWPWEKRTPTFKVRFSAFSHLTLEVLQKSHLGRLCH